MTKEQMQTRSQGINQSSMHTYTPTSPCIPTYTFDHQVMPLLLSSSLATAVLISSTSYLIAHIVRENAKNDKTTVIMSTTLELPTDFAPMKNDLILRAARGQSYDRHT